MRTASRRAMAMLGLALLACDDDSPGTPLFGTWDVTKSEYVSSGDPPESVDVIAAGGSGTIAFNADASYDATIVPSGGTSERRSGTWSFTESSLTMRESGSSVTWVFDRVMEGDTMVLTGADAEFDFDGDDTPEPATWNLTLTPRP